MPEEINRVLTDHSADLLFAPTATAVKHLHNEGIPDSRIHLVGDVMYDAALYYSQKSDQISQILANLNLSSKHYLLATIHRAENTDNPQILEAIFTAFAYITKTIPLVLPLHPRTRKQLHHYQLDHLTQPLTLIDPVGYLDMVQLTKNARLVLTDSGGLQKEAFFHRVPCLTLRTETEWTELVELGWNRLILSTDPMAIHQAIEASLASPLPSALDLSPYGSGGSVWGLLAAMGRGNLRC